METTEGLIREGKRQILSLSHGVQAAVDWKQISDQMDHYDTAVVMNHRPDQVRSVVFLITRMVRFSGGQTSILRIGTELEKQGLRVGYAVYKQQSAEEMELCAKANLPDYRGDLYTKQDVLSMLRNPEAQPDIVIASSWDTVHYVKKFTSYKMYFIQDFEPYFYTFGDRYLLAKKTYEQGLHMVSLGGWNRDEILRNCAPVSPVDCVDFPCDTEGYPYRERDFSNYTDQKVLIFAVYMKYYAKRLPGIIQYMMVHLAEEFMKRDGIRLEVKYFGEAQSFVPKGGVNLGMLSQPELSKLYRAADFGMVASMSNISLVPYEMLASGLPLIEFEDGTFPYFFPEDCAILTSVSWKELYRRLKDSLEHPKKMKQRSDAAQKQLALLSWEKTGVQFYNILQQLKEME